MNLRTEPHPNIRNPEHRDNYCPVCTCPKSGDRHNPNHATEACAYWNCDCHVENVEVA